MSEINITARQRELVRHALGLDGRHLDTWRNHFVATEGSNDYIDWKSMVIDGYANEYPPSEVTGGGFCFTAKRDTALAVRKANEHLGRDWRE